MDIVKVNLRNGKVTFDHFQSRMAKELLESVGITTITQIFDGTGMPEAMDGDITDADARSNGLEQMKDTVTSEWPVSLGDE